MTSPTLQAKKDDLLTRIREGCRAGGTVTLTREECDILNVEIGCNEVWQKQADSLARHYRQLYETTHATLIELLEKTR